jgi:hypothetical protein
MRSMMRAISQCLTRTRPNPYSFWVILGNSPLTVTIRVEANCHHAARFLASGFMRIGDMQKWGNPNCHGKQFTLYINDLGKISWAIGLFTEN